jgi:hypothetical protein
MSSTPGAGGAEGLGGGGTSWISGEEVVQRVGELLEAMLPRVSLDDPYRRVLEIAAASVRLSGDAQEARPPSAVAWAWTAAGSALALSVRGVPRHERVALTRVFRAASEVARLPPPQPGPPPRQAPRP